MIKAATVSFTQGDNNIHEKFLPSDWLRAVQFGGNSAEKRKYSAIFLWLEKLVKTIRVFFPNFILRQEHFARFTSAHAFVIV